MILWLLPLFSLGDGKVLVAGVGDSIIIPCNLSLSANSKVQWMKDGFGLGLDVSLPGYPSLSMPSWPHLTVSPVSLTDDGYYQCQAPPQTSATPVTLKVHVPPSSPSILGGKGDHTGPLLVLQVQTTP